MTAENPVTIDPTLLAERLARFRAAAGFTQQQAADAIGVARTTLTAIEAGQRQARSNEIVQLARLYGRTVHDLVRPSAETDVESFAVQFRAARRPPGTTEDDDLRHDIALFERLCQNYRELEALTDEPLLRRYPEEYDIHGLDIDRAAEEVAEAERNRLRLGDGPIVNLWDTLEFDVGLRIFAPPFKTKRLAGLFAFTQSLGGCIAVNGEQPEVRRRWSACHEYAHFLTERHRAEIAIYYQYERKPSSERFADAFAQHFLMPTSGIVRHFHEQRRAKGDEPPTAGDVVILSHRYRVSFQAMMHRLETLRLIPPGAWERLAAEGFRPGEARGLLGLSSLQPERNTVPLRYETLAIRAYESGQLSEGQFAAIMQTDIVGARETVLEYFAGTTIYQDEADSTWQQTALDLNTSLVAGS